MTMDNLLAGIPYDCKEHKVWGYCFRCREAELQTYIKELEAKCESLKLQAQLNAGEDKGHKRSLFECYKAVGAQKGDWNGSRPVIEYIEALKARLERREAERNALRWAAQAVMQMLEEHGPEIVPHLMDSDDNCGQYLRELCGMCGDVDMQELIEEMYARYAHKHQPAPPQEQSK